MTIQLYLRRLRWLFLAALLAYLPFSAWLISLSGKPELSLVRDILVALIFLSSLGLLIFERQGRHSPVLWLLGVLLVWISASLFWREASEDQWLRGARFTLLPLLTLFSLVLVPFSIREIHELRQIFIPILGVVLITALLEFFGRPLPLVTDASGAGALTQNHRVGSLELTRLQGVLAGPNALGLYLLAAIGWVISGQRRSFFLLLGVVAVLILTFSRSSTIGLLLLTLLSLTVALQQAKRKLVAALGVSSLVVASVAVGLFVYSKPAWRDLITHSDSSRQRVEQYERVWQTRSEIGFLGRGAGTAGPASQYRIDSGPNRWTENSYLDFFEEFGLIGISLLLLTLGWLVVLAWRSSVLVGMAGTAFLLTGLLINFGTGQVGIFSALVLLGLYTRPR